MPSIRTILWSANVALLALAAYGGAVLATVVLERELVKNTRPAAQTRQVRDRRTAKKPVPYSAFAMVLNTNMFRAQRTRVAAPIRPAPRAGSAPAPAPEPQSDKFPLAIILTGTFVMEGASVAFVADSGGRKEKLYRVQECLPSAEDVPSKQCQSGQAKLVRIRAKNIEVEFNQRRYVIEIGAGQVPVVAKAAPQRNRSRTGRRRPTRQKRGAGRAEPFPSVRNEAGIEVRVPAAEVEQAFENFSTLLNDARVVPHMVGGELDGFQIRKIRPGSIFQKIGLENGDVLRSVNGESLTTADQALRLFTLFRNEREISLEIDRKGQSLTMAYLVE